MTWLETIGPPLVLVLILAVWGSSAAWAVGDAQKRGQRGGLLFVLLWICGPLAAMVWLLVRPSRKLIDNTIDTYTNDQDALDAALKLDQLGEWDAAILLYEGIAEKWPENSQYASACIEAIKERQTVS
jgi:hypothetical protein